MDTINETINALLDEAAEYRTDAKEKGPRIRDALLWVASRREEEADALMAEFMTGKPGA